jgi:nucleoside 2-deoxyribosyltransferase
MPTDQKLRAFFASPFNKDFQWIRSSVAAACRELKVDFRPVDEMVTPGESIIGAIQFEIAQCDLAFVVISGLNPNVMYELGLLHSLSKPTAIIADKATSSNLPFDLRSRMFVRYDESKRNEQELKLVVIAAGTRIISVLTDPSLRSAIAAGTAKTPAPTKYLTADLTFGQIDFEEKKKAAEKAAGQKGCETRNVSEIQNGVKGWRLKAKCQGGTKMDVIIDVNGDIKSIDVE